MGRAGHVQVTVVLIPSTLNPGLTKPRGEFILTASKENGAGKIELLGGYDWPAGTALTIGSISYMVISIDLSPSARIVDASRRPSASTFVAGKVGRRDSFRTRGAI